MQSQIIQLDANSRTIDSHIMKVAAKDQNQFQSNILFLSVFKQIHDFFKFERINILKFEYAFLKS